jgi:membrane fusion protein (multidrug efflux system)
MDDQVRVSPPPEQASRGARSRRRGMRLLRILLIVLAVLSIAAGGVHYWRISRHFVSTDDAFVDAYQTQVSPRVAGQVTALLFADNQHVTKGQVLLHLDPRDLQAKLDQATAQQARAQASLLQAQAELAQRQADVQQASANLAVAQADLVQARLDFDRFRAINPAAVTRQQVDNATATFHGAKAKLEAAQAGVGSTQAQVQAARASIAAAEASVRSSQASTEAAELQLSYCTIIAPVTGVVTHRTVDVGNYVSPGQPLFAIVQDGRWITANFKETQLADMRPGQAVDLSIDAIPGTTFHGKVDSFQAGTGTIFSILPAENATGNYVKIVQRIPVKIIFDDVRLDSARFAPGMSVEPYVRVR